MNDTHEFGEVEVVVKTEDKVYTYKLPKVSKFEVGVDQAEPEDIRASLDRGPVKDNPVRRVTFSMRPFPIDDTKNVMTVTVKDRKRKK